MQEQSVVGHQRAGQTLDMTPERCNNSQTITTSPLLYITLYHSNRRDGYGGVLSVRLRLCPSSAGGFFMNSQVANSPDRST